MKKVIILLTSVLLLSSCDETKKVIDTAGQVQLSGSYTVQTINGNLIDENNPTLSFNVLDKGVNGTTGCNRYFGSYSLDLYALSFSELASTEMACEEPIMTIEWDFMKALDQTGSYALSEGVLTLYSKLDRSVLLTAKKDRNIDPEE